MDQITRITGDPRYSALVKRRSRFGWTLTIIMLFIYFGYIGLIAFDKAVLAQPVASGVMSIGIPVGFAIIVATLALTALYVFRANREFDREMEALVAEASE